MPGFIPESVILKKANVTGGRQMANTKKLVLGVRIFNFLVGAVTLAVLAGAFLLTAPRLLGIRPYIVLSGSMEPAVPTGALAYVDTKDKNIEEGDIITFRLSDDSTEITHRAVKIADEGIYTKGDANLLSDAVPVEKDMLVGTFRFYIPWIGFPLSRFSRSAFLLATTWLGFLNLLSIILMQVSRQ